MVDEEAYHHSVRHYHSPFKLEHRNASAFPDPRSPAQRQAAEAAQRQLDVIESFKAGMIPRPSDSHTMSAVSARAAKSPPRTAVPGMIPTVEASVNAASDHFWGASMSPSRMTIDRAEATARRTAATGYPCSPLPVGDDDERHVLTREESMNDWIEQKHLRFGIHKPRRVPYVSREEWVDPKASRADRRVAAGWVSRPLNPHHPKSRFGAVREEAPFGSRRAPPHAAGLPEKINWHNPFRQLAEQDEAEAASSARLQRLPATVLLTEVEERLRYHGVGSLLDVRLASDEAISNLLRDCGFTPTQRMTILWELRKRYPLP